ncbi:hypothetical protein APHAL10511_006408 [Amanita phalloides]|nr:hypothetical protein APHAL10511_006408 [Amanita phalloides]
MSSDQLSSSSSSSASLPVRARLGALAAVLEHAITRWARSRVPSSNLSSDSFSSSNTRSKIGRRRYSSASSVSVDLERELTTHIALVKARKASRRVPRQFSLYLPPVSSEKHGSNISHGLTITTSLPLILEQLDLAFKRTVKIHRTRGGKLSRAATADLTSSSSEYGTSATLKTPATTHRRNVKGKNRADSLPVIIEQAPDAISKSGPKAWYLDVASPSWEDLRAIGKLLHLHPLTLEDILQNEPREKLELFPKLGYYFVSFRAIETRGNMLKIGGPPDEAPIETNVYLTVFKDGICSFHFTDISEHTHRVRNRIHHLEDMLTMTSDWIAHGLLDSIVDSFFPYMEQIDEEVIAIDKLVYSRHNQVSNKAYESPSSLESIGSTLPEKVCDLGRAAQNSIGSRDEKVDLGDPGRSLRRTRLFTLNLSRFFGRLICLISKRNFLNENLSQNSKVTLRRIARARRLVTILNRLLATKSEVIARIQKRLLMHKHFMDGGSCQGALDIAMYMGDVQDHIYTLQHSLAHYERILSQLHPIYLLQLRTDFALAKSGESMALFYLTAITVAALCIQSYVGIFSLNIYVPHNELVATGSYHVFAVVMLVIIAILIVYSVVVCIWWKQAKRRRRTGL